MHIEIDSTNMVIEYVSIVHPIVECMSTVACWPQGLATRAIEIYPGESTGHGFPITAIH